MAGRGIINLSVNRAHGLLQIPVRARNDNYLLELKRNIYNETGVPPICQIINLRGEEIRLPDNDLTPLQALGFIEGDIIQLGEDKTKLSDGTTYLLKAIDDGNVSAVRTLIENDEVAINQAWTYCAMSPLHFTRTNPEIIALLLAAGADVQGPDEYGNIPIQLKRGCAEWEDDAEQAITEYLIMGGSELMEALSSSGGFPLHSAAANNLIRTQCELEAGADPTRPDRTTLNNTPLHEVGNSYYFDTVPFSQAFRDIAGSLLLVGADPNVLNANLQSPYATVCTAWPRVAREFVEAGGVHLG